MYASSFYPRVSRRRPASSFIITRHQNREGRVRDIHHRLTARITGAAIEVGGVMEYMELADRFVTCIHAPQLVDNALNLAVINIARRQREPACRLQPPVFAQIAVSISLA